MNTDLNILLNYTDTRTHIHAYALVHACKYILTHTSIYVDASKFRHIKTDRIRLIILIINK